jgi:hypothetical protein
MEPKDSLLVASEPAFAIATLGRALLLVWRARPTMAGVRAAREAMTRLSDAHEEGIGLLVVLERHAPLPDALVREAMVSAVRSLGKRLVVMVALHERTGFAAATVRSVVVGLALVTRAVPLSVAGNEIEACARLSAELARRGTPLGSGPLLGALRSLRTGAPGPASPA